MNDKITCWWSGGRTSAFLSKYIKENPEYYEILESNIGCVFWLIIVIIAILIILITWSFV
jgi:hypothetical protein